MNTKLKITRSRTTAISSKGRPNGYDLVPERLVQIDGIDYVRCDIHGLIPLDHECSASPSDHWCRSAAHPNWDPEDGDQGVSHRDWSGIQSEKLMLIAHLHSKILNDDGSTDGTCAECDTLWPCRTVHLANGWGLGDECYANRWCEHARVPVI